MIVRFNLKEYDLWCDENKINSHIMLYENQKQEVEIDTETNNITWFRDEEEIYDNIEKDDSMLAYVRYLKQLERQDKINNILCQK